MPVFSPVVRPSLINRPGASDTAGVSATARIETDLSTSATHRLLPETPSPQIEYTVYEHLPFPRNCFVDPPQVREFHLRIPRRVPSLKRTRTFRLLVRAKGGEPLACRFGPRSEPAHRLYVCEGSKVLYRSLAVPIALLDAFTNRCPGEKLYVPQSAHAVFY